MSWTTLCTATAIKRDMPMIVSASLPNATITGNIADAQDVVYDDLSKVVVDWDTVEALTSPPRVLNRLCRYQTCMLTIIRQYGCDNSYLGDVTNDNPMNTMYKYFEKRYNVLIGQIQSGSISILDSDNDEYETDTIKPLGMGRVI